MNRTYLITGSASGIGRATQALLEARGDRVIGVDVSPAAEIQVNLGTEEGRRAMVAAAERLTPQGLDGVLAGAGISDPKTPSRAPETISVNYFGAVATLEGLRPLLSRSSRGRAVAICSTSALLPTNDTCLQACLAGDEAMATRAIEASPELAYMTSKRALSLWVRRAATTTGWGGAGILLNGVAPGVVKTPISAPILSDPAMVEMLALANPMAVQGYAQPEELAELIAFLLGMENHYLVGQVIFMDGGTDAIMRPDSF